MAKLEREIHMLQYPDWTAKDNYARNRGRRKNRTKEKELKVRKELKAETVAFDDDQDEGLNDLCVRLICPYLLRR